MARIVPWPSPEAVGFINVHYFTATGKVKGMPGRPFIKLADFCGFIRWAVAHPGYINDLYFCLSQQSEVGAVVNNKARAKRLAQNAISFKAIWADVDVKPPPKGYATIEEAITAIGEFLKASGYPRPSAMVASGGGLHLYWVSDIALTPEEWMPYAEGLKAAILKHGLRADAGCTTDLVRVLRIPGTFNYKTSPPKPVKLLALQPTDYAFKSDLPAYTGPVGHLPVTATVSDCFDPSKFPKRALPPEGMESLSAGLVREFIPLDPAPIIKGCPFYKEALITGGKNHDQPLWNLVVLGTTFMENGHTLAHAMGNKYPGYDVASTDAMWSRKDKERQAGLGWPSCKAVQSNGCDLCASCEHFGKIKSPLNLAVAAQAVPVLPPFPTTQVVNGITVPAFPMPPGYDYDKKTGWIGFLYEKPIGQGNSVTQVAPLFLCDISRVWAEQNPDALHYTASMSKGHTRDITVKQEHFASTQSLTLTLSKQGVKFKPHARERLGEFHMDLLTKMHQAEEAKTSVPYGWWPKSGTPHGFAYDGQIIRDDGTVDPCGGGDQKLRNEFAPLGGLQPWFDAFRLVTSQNRPELEAIVAISFGAPLMRMTGYDNGTVSAYGQAGGNKTTAVLVATSVWGHPKRTKMPPGSSAKGVLKRVGEIRNLGAFWDDVQDDELDKVVTTTMELSPGVGAIKLRTDRTELDTGEWQSLLTITSNSSALEHMMKKNQNNAAAPYRTFEFNIPVPMSPVGRMASHEATLITQHLEENFGRMGQIYAAKLGRNPALVASRMRGTMTAISKLVKDIGPERFWIAISAAILVGADLANECIREVNPEGPYFNIDTLMLCLVKTFHTMRQRVNDANIIGGSAGHTENSLTGFFKASVANTAWTDTMHTGRGKPPVVALINCPNGNYPKAIHMRWIINDRLLRISKDNFVGYMMAQKRAAGPSIEGLKDHYNMHIPKKTMNIASGTNIQGGAETVFEIPVPPGSPLEEELFKHTPLDQRPVLPVNTPVVTGIRVAP